MAKQLNVNLNINADSKQAKAVFQDLQQTLTKLQGTIATNPKNMFNVQEIKAASTAAKELQQHLLAATDVNTGRLNLATFSQSLKSSGKDLVSYKTQLESMGPVGEQAFMKVAKSIALAENPIRRTNTLLTEFKTTLVNTARWQISSSILHGFIGAIRGAYGYAQDLNESLNNIRTVTGYDVDKMSEFAAEANKAAKALSTTTTAYTDAALIYYQQGLGDKAVKDRTDVTIKMANVSRQSAEEVSNQMTAIWNNFDDGSKKLEYYADVITALGAATASSSEEISTGLEKFSAVAETVGLSYEYATSALATITATTRQSADVVGTALKTLFARIQDLELGETLEDGTTLGKYSAALEVVGVNIKDINGEVKDMDIILDELGAKWNTIAKDEQIALAQTVAGTRQYTQLIALMDNWDFMQQNLQTARESEGTLQKQADIYAESWAAASKRVKASLETIYAELLNDKFFIALNNGFAGLLDGISGFVKGMGGLQGVLSTIGAFITQSLAKEAPVALERIKESLLQISGISQRQGAEMQNQLSQWLQGEQRSALAGVQEGTGSAEYLAQVNTLDILAQKRREYNQLESQYNSSQKAEAQQILAVLEAQGQAYENTGKQIDKTNTNLENMRQKMLEVVSSSSRSNASLALFSAQDIAKAQGSLQGLQTQLVNLKDAYKDKSPEEYAEQLEKLANRAHDIDQVLPQSSGAFKNLVQQFKDGTLSAEEFAEELGSKLVESINSANDPLERIRDNLVDTYGIPRNTINQFIQAQKDAGASTEDIITKLQNFKNTIGQLPQPLTTTSTQLMSFASGLMQVNAAINSVTRIVDVFNDDDATAIQKISAVIGGLTTAMFLFNAVNKLTTNVLNAQNKSLFGNLGAWLRSRIAKTADTTATVANTGAEGANTGAKIAGKAASDALNTSLGTTLALMGPIIAILGAVVLAIYAVIAAIKKAKENSPEGQLKKTKKALDEVKESYDELKDSLTDIQDQQNALKELENGTLEWNEAVQKLNQSILEVLQTYPQLAGAVKNINGYLELDTNSEVYKNFLQEQLRGYERALQEYQQAQIKINDQNRAQALNSVGKELRRSGLKENDEDYKAIMELAESGKLTSEKLADYFAKDNENGTTLAEHAGTIEALVKEIVGYEQNNNLLEEQIFQSDLRAANIESYNNLDSAGQRVIAQGLQNDKSFQMFDEEDEVKLLSEYIKSHPELFMQNTSSQYSTGYYKVGDNRGIIDPEDWLNNNKDKISEVYEAIGLTLSQVAEDIGQQAPIQKEQIEQKVKEYTSLLAKIPEDLQEAVKTQDFSKLSKEQLERLDTLFRNMSKSAGDGWALILNTTAPRLFEAINQAIQKQIDKIASGENLVDVQNSIATDNKNVGSLSIGDTIDGEKYHELSDGLKGYFKTMEDGTYKLMDEAEELKQALFSIHLKDAFSGLQDFLSTTPNRYSSSENNVNSLVGVDPSQLTMFTPEQEEIAQNWANTIALTSTNLGELNVAIAQISSILPDATIVVEAERQALMDLATQYETCKEELNALQYAYQENDEQAKKNAATNLELAISAAEQAAANGLEASTVESLTKIFKAENDELAKTSGNLRSTAEAASDAAVRFMRLNNGISDLYTNFKKYDTVLDDISKATTAAEKATIAFSKDGTALRETLADILDTSSDLIDADLLGHIDSSTLEEAAMGSEEAINRIRDAFIDAQAAAAGLADSPELQAFKDSLAELEEGAVINLDTDSFLYKLIEAQLAAGATSEDIKAMLSGFGIDADVEPFEQAMADAADVAAQAAVSVTESGDAIIAGGSINAETNTVTAGSSDTQENVGFDEDVTITTVHGQGRVLQAGSSGGGNYNNSASLYGVTDAAVVAAAASNDRTVPVDVYYPVARKTVTPRKVTESADKTQSATAVKLSNIHKSAGGKVTTKNRTTTSPRSSGGGGGGGGGSAPKHSARTSSGGIHRYSRSENTVSSLSKQIDRLGKARENAWGLKTLNVMDQEVDKLGKLKEAYEGYIKEVAGTNWKSLHDKIQKGIALTQEDLLGSGGYLKKDLEAILNGRQISVQTEDENGNQQVKNVQRAGIANILGAYGISGLEFDDLGRINNIDEINDAIDKAQEVWIDSWWNAFDATQQEDVANKNELARRTAILDDLKESISLYNDETIQKLIELSDENQDLIYQIQDFHADILNSKLEFNVSLSENNIKRLETAMKVLGDNFYKTAEVMSMIYSGNGNDQYQNYLNQGHSYMNYYEDLRSRFQLWQEDNNNPEGIDLAHFIEGAQKVQDGLYETIDNLISINEQMKEYYGNTLARAREELEKLTSQMEHHVNIMEHLKNIMSLLNKETDYDTLEKIIRSQMAMRKNAFDVSTKWHKEALADQLAAEEEYNKLIAAGQEENARVYKEAVLDKAIERTREAEEQMYADAEAYLESVNELYTNTINQIMAKHEKFLTDGFGWDFLSESISKASSIQEEYLTKTNQIYETNVLLRKLAQDIDKTDNTAAKSKLKNFSDEIVAMQQQERLSKNDLEIAKARYEVLQAEIALTDAQNAKSTVRLQRDNEGNYGYVYTADQAAIDDAQQNYADKQNDLYNLVLEQTNTYGQKLIELEQERDAEIAALAEEYRGAEGEKYQEYLQKKADLIQKYNDLFYAYEDSYNKGVMWLNRTAATDYSEAWITEYENVINKSRDYKNEIITEFDEVEAEMRDYHENTKPILEETAIGLGDIDKKTQDVLDANTALANQIIRNGGLIDALEGEIREVEDATQVWAEHYEEIMNNIRAMQDYAMMVQGDINGTQGDLSVDYTRKMITALQNGEYEWNSDEMKQDMNLRQWKINTTGMKPDWHTGEEYNRALTFYLNEGLKGYLEPALDELAHEVGEDSAKSLISKYTYREFLKKFNREPKFEIAPYDTGGFTGEWTGGGKLALLHQKELVLNAVDTANLLTTVQMVRELASAIDLRAAAANYSSGLSSSTLGFGGGIVEQEVTIHAEFPNVVNHTEIEDAFTNLINRASQFANRR